MRDKLLKWNSVHNANTTECVSDSNSDLEYELTWPTLEENQVRWVPYISLDSETDIVDRFANIVQIHEKRTQESPMRENQKSFNRQKMGHLFNNINMNRARNVDNFLGINNQNRVEKLSRKSRLHERLQNGMNLQVCFMNETASDSENTLCDNEKKNLHKNYDLSINCNNNNINNINPNFDFKKTYPISNLSDLQNEMRMTLMQKRKIIQLQFQNEKRQQIPSPIEEVIRNSFDNIGVSFPVNKRRITRQLLTRISNLTHLQIILNDLHKQIDIFNDNLVSLLIERDNLCMQQDSMLVDIVDFEQYISAKEQNLNKSECNQVKQNDLPPLTTSLITRISTLKPRLEKIKNFVKI